MGAYVRCPICDERVDLIERKDFESYTNREYAEHVSARHPKEWGSRIGIPYTSTQFDKSATAVIVNCSDGHRPALGYSMLDGHNRGETFIALDLSHDRGSGLRKLGGGPRVGDSVRVTYEPDGPFARMVP